MPLMNLEVDILPVASVSILIVYFATDAVLEILTLVQVGG